MSTKTQRAVRAFFRQYMEAYPYSARIEHYKKEARKHLKANKVAKGASTLHPCELVLLHADEAIHAAQRGDFNHFAQAFERVIRESINSNLPGFIEKIKAAGVSQSQSNRARNPRGPRPRTRAVLAVLMEGSNTAHEVEAYLNNNREISGECGDFDIESKRGRFLITELKKDGTELTTELKLKDIPNVLATAKKLLSRLAG